MLDLLRAIKSVLNEFSTMTVLGVPMDWFFHLLGAAVFVFGASRVLPLRRAVWLTVALIVAKELVDVFAKTRVEYIRAPGLDILLDLSAGLGGLALGWWLARRFPRWLSRRRAS